MILHWYEMIQNGIKCYSGFPPYCIFAINERHGRIGRYGENKRTERRRQTVGGVSVSRRLFVFPYYTYFFIKDSISEINCFSNGKRLSKFM